MKAIHWRIFAPVLILFALLFPRLQQASESVQTSLARQKQELGMAEHLMKHRSQYEALKKKLEEKGESLWGNADPGELTAELERVSESAAVPILDIQPHGPEDFPGKNQIGAELNLEGSMQAVGKFLYGALRLPGIMSVEKLSLSDAGRGGGEVAAQIFIVRKIPPRS